MPPRSVTVLRSPHTSQSDRLDLWMLQLQVVAAISNGFGDLLNVLDAVSFP
jgi:hypothetical protein